MHALTILIGAVFMASHVVPASERGTFDYYVNKQKVGNSTYEYLPGKELSNRFELHMEDLSYRGQVRIVFSGQDDWENVFYENNGNSVQMKNIGSEIVISAVNQEQRIPNTSQGNLVEDMTPFLLQLLIWKHASRSPEIQFFNTYFVPVLQVRGEIEYMGSSELIIQNESGMYSTYRVNLPPVYEMEILADEDNNICIIYYRAQNGAFVKPGFEELL